MQRRARTKTACPNQCRRTTEQKQKLPSFSDRVTGIRTELTLGKTALERVTMKRVLTPEQKEKSESRKLRFRELVKRVAAMTDEQKAQLTSQMGCVMTCEGHAMSLCNTMLLLIQTGGTVSMVGGFRQWIKQGRCVRKGEHGHMIWVPTGGKANDVPLDGSTSNSAVVDGEPAGESDRRFIIGTVFDIGQTDEFKPDEFVETGKVHVISGFPIPEVAFAGDCV